MAKKKKKFHVGYRDCFDGRFITEVQAEKAPMTSEKESIPNPGYGDTSRTKKRRR